MGGGRPGGESPKRDKVPNLKNENSGVCAIYKVERLM